MEEQHGNPKEQHEKAEEQHEKKKKVVGVPFPKGKSGNPSGRPKIPDEVREANRLKMMSLVSPAILTFENVLTGKDETARASDKITVAIKVIEYNYGKDVQPNLNINVPAEKMSREDRSALISHLIDKLRDDANE